MEPTANPREVALNNPQRTVWPLPQKCWQIDFAIENNRTDAILLRVVERLLAGEYPRVGKPLGILFEPRFNAKTFQLRKHPRVLFAGEAAESWARSFGRDKPAAMRSLRQGHIDVERMAQLKPVLFFEGQRVVGLDHYPPVAETKALTEAGFVVEEQTVSLISTDLPGMRGTVRLSYDFGYIDVLAANKPEAQDLVVLRQDTLPQGTAEPGGVRGFRPKQPAPTAEIINVVRDATAGAKEQDIAYQRRWASGVSNATASLGRPPRAVTKQTIHPPRKTGPFGQRRTKKD